MSRLLPIRIHRPKALLLPLLLAAFTISAMLHAAAAPHAAPPGGAGPAPGPQKKNELSLFSNQLKISLSSVPFANQEPGDFIVREFVVQNNLSDPVDIRIALKFTSDPSSENEKEEDKRIVTTERKVPAHSEQTIQLFIPVGFPFQNNQYIHGAAPCIMGVNSTIYVNGEEFKDLFPDFGDRTDIDEKFLPLPPSFGKDEKLVLFLRSILSGHDYSPLFWHKDRLGSEFNVQKEVIADPSVSDTIQWPSIPQFYHSKSIIFRKSGDIFHEDAERAIQDAVMLGSTELLLIEPGDSWPDWAPKPASRGLPVIVPRGLGQSVVLYADAVQPYFEESNDPSAKPRQRKKGPANTGEADYDSGWTAPDPGAAQNGAAPKEHTETPTPEYALDDNDLADVADEVTRANIWTVNPAQLFMILPHVKTPTVPFLLIRLALLAYIIIVGPVNYFIFVRKKKRNVLILLLTVPIISIAFVAVVFLFVGTIEGWHSRASAVGVTFLDQQEKMAYTRAGVNLYASLPIRKMTFDTADSVTFTGMKNIDIELGSKQVISGTNQARIPLAYTVSRAEHRLEQLRITRNADGGISVMNGLGVPLKSLIVKLEDGRIWTAGPASAIQPGESVALAEFTGNLPSMEKVRAELAGELSAKSPGDIRFPFNNLLLTASALLFEVPSDITPDQLSNMLPESFYGNLGSVNPLALLAAKKALQDPDVVKALLPRGLYMAETDKPVFYTPGCAPASFRARHIVFGNFTVQEAKSNEN